MPHRRSLQGNFLLRFVDRKFKEIIPCRVKRMLYVSSVIGMILKGSKPDAEMFRLLNIPLRLANRPDSMVIMAAMWDFIWSEQIRDRYQRELNALTLAPDKEIWQLAATIALHCPDWLQYGTEQLMAADIFDSIKTLGKIQMHRLEGVN